jgi:hypothetical protein
MVDAKRISFDLINLFITEGARLREAGLLEQSIVSFKNACCVRKLCADSIDVLDDVINEISNELRFGKK